MNPHTLRQGTRGAVTPAQLSRMKGAPYGQSYGGQVGARIAGRSFATTEYTGAGPYALTWDHGIGTDTYIWHVIKTDTNGAIIVEDFWQGEDSLVLYFTGNAHPVKITMVW